MEGKRKNRETNQAEKMTVAKMLSLVIAIVLIILIIIVALILSVLFIPFSLTLTGSASIFAPAKFEFAFGWIGITLWRFKPGKTPARSREKKPKEKKETQPDVQRVARILTYFRDSIPAFTALSRYARKAIHIQYLNIDLILGLGDPAETALTAGYIWAFAWILNQIPFVEFSLRPDLREINLQSNFSLKLKVRTIYLVIGFLLAYSKKPFRQLIKEVRTTRKGDEKLSEDSKS